MAGITDGAELLRRLHASGTGEEKLDAGSAAVEHALAEGRDASAAEVRSALALMPNANPATLAKADAIMAGGEAPKGPAKARAWERPSAPEVDLAALAEDALRQKREGAEAQARELEREAAEAQERDAERLAQSASPREPQLKPGQNPPVDGALKPAPDAHQKKK